MRFLLLGLTCASALMLAACGGSDSSPPAPATGTVAEFNPNPANTQLPFPINLLFSGTEDGTLNIPVDDPNNFSDPLVALNALDGFSTVAPISTTFSGPVDSNSLVAGSTVRIFEVTLTGIGGGVTGVSGELTPADFVATLVPNDPSLSNLIILPLRPLKPKTSYLVILTNGIQDTTGAAVQPSEAYRLFQGSGPAPGSLENIRLLVQSQELAAQAAGIPQENIILTWTFSTQSIDDVLVAVHDSTQPQTSNIVPTGLSTAELGIGLPGRADIFTGTLEIPYFLDRSAPLTGFWQGSNGSNLTQFNPQPITTETLSIPLLITVPNANSGHTKPASGWSVVIFQHGITQNRSNLFAVADSLATVGFVGVAIDLPLHGITDTSSPFFTSIERTFDLDLLDNSGNNNGPDGVIDSSGSHFINLASLLTSRDNLRQAVSDLFHLTVTVPNMDLNGDNNPDFDGSRIHFVGHSLGAIAGIPFLAVETEVNAATLAMPGGGIPKLLIASESFGPIIKAGLAANGLVEGTPEFESFLLAAQTATDSGDAINYINAATEIHPIHMIEIVGGAGSPPDQTIPNNVPGAPLSGTEPLARITNLPGLDRTTTDTSGVHGIVRFTEGSHSSILSPAASAAATLEIQSEMASFMASDGTTLLITNPDVIQPAP